MPRPARKKVTPSANAPRKATQTVAPHNTAPPTADNDPDHIYDISDPDEVIAAAQRARKGKGKGKELDVIQAKGSASKATNRARRIEENASDAADSLPMMTGALGNAEEESELPEIDLNSSSPAAEVGRRDTSIMDNSALAIGNFKRRPRERSILGRTTSRGRRGRSSSVESNLAENNGLMSVGKRNTSTIGNFKRRPREASILGRNAGNTRESSMGLEMDRGTPAVASAMKIGNFKRRAREPSILGTAQKKRTDATQYELEDDEDDFSPDDESTPLHLSKTRAMVTSSAGSSNSRKRKLSQVQVPRSQESPSGSPALGDSIEHEETVPATGPLEDEDEEEDELAGNELQDVRGSPSPDLPIPSVEPSSLTPEPLSETMAPPESSSPGLRSPPLPRQIRRPQSQRPQNQRTPRRGRPPLRNRTPLPINQDSPPSSPPSLTHSPNLPAPKTAPRTRAKKEPPPASTLSTAELQALLPRRRRHTTRDPFGIDSEGEYDISGLASDEDELTSATIRVSVPRGSIAPRSTAARKVPKLKPGTKPKSGVRTYGRNAASDKENDVHDPDDSLGPLPDDDGMEDSVENSQALEKRVGKELKKAARKFQEVDKWELDFEDCTGGSSSPKDAR